MTKQRELEILAGAISELGNDSYCGPWLASVAGEVEMEIRSDYLPSLTMSATKAASDALIVEAREAADKIIAEAKLQAAQVVNDATDYVVRLRQRTANDLKRAAELALG
jgi:cell division septum initiation protein DivIVA